MWSVQSAARFRKPHAEYETECLRRLDDDVRPCTSHIPCTLISNEKSGVWICLNRSLDGLFTDNVESEVVGCSDASRLQAGHGLNERGDYWIMTVI